MFPELNLPTFSFSIQKRDKQYEVWDILRKSWLKLTPEEWVRQHILHYLIQKADYPPEKIKSEHPIHLGENTQRADIVVYNKQFQPEFVIECKAPEVKIKQAAIDQASRYNYQLKAQFLLVSNGMEHFMYEVKTNGLVLMQEIPKWSVF